MNRAYVPQTGLGDVDSLVSQSTELQYQFVVTPVTFTVGSTRSWQWSGIVSMPNPNGHRNSIEVSLNLPNDVGTIQRAVPTWVVIHGRVDDRNSFQQLASRLRTATGQQVLLLEWSDGAFDNNGNSFPEALSGAEWIPYVADWAASALRSAGITGSRLNLAGHSWGTYVAARIAAPERSGEVNALVAMDPARYGVGFRSSGVDSIHFGAVSRWSWAFYGNGSFGSAPLAGTADESFTIESDEFSSSLNVGSYQRHSAPIHVFEFLVLHNTTAFGRAFQLSRLLANRRNPVWQLNAIRSEWTVSGARGELVFEGTFTVRANGGTGVNINWLPVSFTYIENGTDNERTVT